ncbi:hypothetical protein BAY61_31710 (plasmid) [Prauserella marina]|nr:hypothetical protein BAY61_31710 [Prauserella marina]
MVDQDTGTKEPATGQGAEQHERPPENSTSARAAVTKTASTATAEDTSVTGEQVAAAGGSANSGLDEEGKPAAELRIDGQEPDDGAPASFVITDPAGADADEQIKPAAELDVEVDEDLDDEEFTGSKLTQQSWVPDDVADKFQRMQATGHGRTAEVIVLTAVRNCAERLPELIKAARGPVHEDGLFAGLPILDRKPGRQKKAKPNSSRVQYQVSPVYAPDLKRLAKMHKLKLSVLIRLALGDYFGIPVRLGRTKR